MADRLTTVPTAPTAARAPAAIPRPPAPPAAAASPRSLSGLLPFLRPYRGRIALAVLFLVLAAASTLVLPVALKSLIDSGLVAAEPGERVMALRGHFFALFAGRRGTGLVFGSALLHGQLARRARHGRPAQRRLCPRGRAKPRVLRDHADRRGVVAADDRHHAGADRRRLEPQHGPAQHRDGHRRAGHAGDHQPLRDDAGARHPGAGGAAQRLLRPPRAQALARQPGPRGRFERDRRRGAERYSRGAELHPGAARSGALCRRHRERLRHGKEAHARARDAGGLHHHRHLRRAAVGPVPGHAGGAGRADQRRAPRARPSSTC